MKKITLLSAILICAIGSNAQQLFGVTPYAGITQSKFKSKLYNNPGSKMLQGNTLGLQTYLSSEGFENMGGRLFGWEMGSSIGYIQAGEINTMPGIVNVKETKTNLNYVSVDIYGALIIKKGIKIKLGGFVNFNAKGNLNTTKNDGTTTSRNLVFGNSSAEEFTKQDGGLSVKISVNIKKIEITVFHLQGTSIHPSDYTPNTRNRIYGLTLGYKLVKPNTNKDD